MGLSHDEQPGLELAPVIAPQVAYGEGLEYDPSKPVPAPYNQTLHSNPSISSHQGQHHDAPMYDPYGQSAYLNSATSGWSPASNGVMPVGGHTLPEKPPQQEYIWGMRRRTFWLILGGFLIGMLVVALALGLGLGLGLNQEDTSR